MRHRLSALAVAGLVAGACASSPPWVSPAEHERLVRQLLELERRSARSELEIERLKKRLAELEDGATGAAAPAATPRAPAATPGAPPMPATATPEPGWREARGAIEETELAEAESPPTAAGGTPPDYERGLALLRDGEPARAESALLAFAEAEPSSDLADNAWFWIGESRAVRGDTSGAIAAYRNCLERYPDGNKVPDAMLKLGQAFAAEGDADGAREVWSELVRRFPSTAAAESARGRLAAP